MRARTLQFFCMIALTASVLLFLIEHPASFRVFIGPLYMGYPFLDLHCVLAHTEGYLRGWDVRHLESNPLDYLGRGKPAYPMVWYYIFGALGFTRKIEIPLSLAFDGLFLGVAFLLLKPRSWSAVLIGFLAICSPGVILAMERANVDLVIFIILSPVPLLLERPSRTGPILGWLVLYAAMALKYFPAIGYLLFLRTIRNFRFFFWMAFSAAAAVSAYVIINLQDLVTVREQVEENFSIFTFGAKNVFYSAGVREPNIQIFPWLGLVLILGGCLLFALKAKPPSLPDSSRSENFFLMGTAVSAFCFFALSNYDYRTVFSLFTLPWLMTLADRRCPYRSYRWAARILLGLILTLMWFEALYLFYVFDPSTLQWKGRAVDLKMVFIFKHGLSWVVMALLMGLAAIGLKPNLLELRASFLALYGRGKLKPSAI